MKLYVLEHLDPNSFEPNFANGDRVLLFQNTFITFVRFECGHIIRKYQWSI
jgi:hypothetical protein